MSRVVEAHRIAAWLDDSLSGGEEALKGRRGPRTEDDANWEKPNVSSAS